MTASPREHSRTTHAPQLTIAFACQKMRLHLQESKPTYVRLPEGEKQVFRTFGPSKSYKVLHTITLLSHLG